MNYALAPQVPFGRVGYMVVGAPPERVMAVGDALEAGLAAVGWTRSESTLATVGNPAGVQMARGPWKFDVRLHLAEVAMRARSPEQWQEACRVAGIDGVQIAMPVLQSLAPQTFQAEAGPAPDSGGLSQKLPGAILLVALALVLVFLARPIIRDNIRNGAVKANATSSAAAKPAYITADGKSNLAGGYATASYSISGHDWETIHAPTNEDGPNDAAQWWLGQSLPDSMLHFGIDHRIWNPPVVTRKDEARFVTVETGFASNRANGKVKTGTTTVAGRRAYTLEYTDKDGSWNRETYVLGPVHSLIFYCSNDKPAADNVKVSRSRCKSFLASVKFHVSD